MLQQSEETHDPYAAFRIADFRRFMVGNCVAITGRQMQAVAVGWQLYESTNSALALGLVGLVQIVPLVLLALPAGHIADQHNRRLIVMLAEAVLAVSALGLAIISITGSDARLIYLPLLINGLARAFEGPAKSALLPQVVPRDAFANAVTWNSGTFQLASVIGPALGGLLIARFGSPTLVYALNAAGSAIFFTLLATIKSRAAAEASSVTDESITAAAATVAERSTETIAAGLRYVWRTKIVLGAITLDMFAVLLGGATTLLPIYAKDILHTDASGLGWLLAASPGGAVAMVLVLALRPPLKRAGSALLLSVAGFGGATIIFGLSHSFWLSLAMLFLLGALDQISVVIRHTLVQTQTPDALRGRVSAVNGVFVGTSNELGGFESGFVAWLVGPVATVVGGGICTIIVVIVIALLFPQLRRYGSLTSNAK